MKNIFAFAAIFASIACQIRGQTTPCPNPNPHCDCSDLINGDITCIAISEIPEDLPSGTTVLDLEQNFLGPTLIRIQVNRLGRIDLLELYINNNGISFIEDNSFDLLYNLTVLDISENSLQAFTDNTFVGLKSLNYLYANSIGLMYIPPRVFESLPNLLHIDLEDNKLTTIGREFSVLRNLHTLLLARNLVSGWCLWLSVKQIARESFSSLTSLTHLSLFGNNLTIPQPLWFTTIVENNGNIELDRRADSSKSHPNPWLCCPAMNQYFHYLATVPSSLASYYQINVACHWPVELSGRLVSTLSESEITAVPCVNYTYTTTASPYIATSSTTTSTRPPPTIVVISNFMGGLNDVGAFFILLFIAVLSGAIVGGCCYLHKNDAGKQKLRNLLSVRYDRDGSAKNRSTVTTRPYRTPPPSVYGATVDVIGRQSDEPEKPKRPAPPPPPTSAASRDNNAVGDYTSVVKPIEMTYSNYTMETDQSEDEIWSKVERKSPV
ncbi:uncharacterized protein LOC143446580 isoform X2 [Clavelina lepadiformis]|uniref:uncharacterized protein LOC143446580 isoform X2 n=1 Tax=Clavelina lepadiformis TaxID=159417 RepID=UPI0040419BE1